MALPRRPGESIEQYLARTSNQFGLVPKRQGNESIEQYLARTKPEPFVPVQEPSAFRKAKASITGTLSSAATAIPEAGYRALSYATQPVPAVSRFFAEQAAGQQELGRTMGRPTDWRLEEAYEGGVAAGRQPLEAARAASYGAGKAAASNVGAIGQLTGIKPLQRVAEQAAATYPEATTTAQKVGEFGGRMAGEIAAAAMGLGAMSKIPAIGRGLQGASRLTRAIASAAGSAPIDVVQAKAAGEGFFLPGTTGALAENVFLSSLGGAITSAPKPQTMARSTDRVAFETDPRRLLPERTPERSASRLLPERTLERPVPETPSAGPGIPMGGGAPRITEPSRLLPEAVPERSPFAEARLESMFAPRVRRIPAEQVPTSASPGEVRRYLQGVGLPAPAQKGVSPATVRPPLTEAATKRATELELDRAAKEAEPRLRETELLDRYPDGTLRVTPKEVAAEPYTRGKKAPRNLNDRDLDLEFQRLQGVIDDSNAAIAEYIGLEQKMVKDLTGRGGIMGAPSKGGKGSAMTGDMYTPAQWKKMQAKKRGEKGITREKLTISERYNLGYDLSDEMREQIFDAGYDIPSFRRVMRAAGEAEEALPKLQARFDALSAEYTKRGLNALPEELPPAKGKEAPNWLIEEIKERSAQFVRDESGAASPAAAAQIGSGAAGFVAGAATTPEGEQEDWWQRGLVGAGAAMGATAGIRSALRGGAEAATTAAPALRNIDEAAEAMRRKPEPFTGPVDARDYQNFGKITDDPDVLSRLEAVTPRVVREMDVGLRADGPTPGRQKGELLDQQTFQSVREQAARDLKIDPTEIAERTIKGETLTPVDIVRMKTALQDVIKEENALFRLLNTETIDSQQRAIAERVMERLGKERDVLMTSLTKQGTQAGRLLNSFKIGALQTDDPKDWALRLQRLAQRSLTPEEMDVVLTGDRAKVEQLARDVFKSSNYQKVLTFTKAGLLSNPKTQVVNLTGNMTMQGMETAKDVVASFFDWALGKYTGVRTKDLDIAETLAASKRGAKRGLSEAKAALRGQRPTMNLMDQREVNYNNPILDYYTKGIYRFMDATDRLFHSTAYQRSLEEQARVMAKEQAKTEGVRLTKDALKSRVEQILSVPTDAMDIQAKLDADYAVFRNDSKLSKGASNIRRVMKFAGADFLLPFVKTPANIAGAIIDYTPVGAALQLKNFLKLAKDGPNYAAQKQVVEGLARSSVGTAAIATGYMLAAEGKMTGFFPADQETRNQWQQTGRTEGSVLAGDQWFRASQISPLGNMMTIGASMYEAAQSDSPWQQVFGVGMAPARTLLDLPMVSALSDIVDIATEKEAESFGEKATGMLARQAQAMIPASSLLRGVAQVIDPTIRETKAPTVLESATRQVQAGIPFLSKQLPERIDVLGEPRERARGIFGRIDPLITPVGVSRDLTVDSPVRKELERVNVSFKPPKQMEGESNEAFTKRARTVGSAVSRAVSEVTSSPEYRAIEQQPMGEIRTFLEANGVNTERMSDAEIRRRYQGTILKNALEKVRGEAGKEFAKPGPKGIGADLLRRFQ